MARYDGLIIPRSYSDYINKSDAATLSQALQQSGALDEVPTANSARGARSGGIFAANAVIMASSTTVTGPTISSGSILRIMFTSAVTGSNTTTAMRITYNGTSYSVKVGKNGSLANFVASYVNSAYKYVQAYTTLELAFNGSNFIIIGNPVVLSSSDYTIYADGVTNYQYHTLPLNTSPTTGTGEKTFIFDLTNLFSNKRPKIIAVNIGGSNNKNSGLVLEVNQFYSTNIIELGKTDTISYSYDSSLLTVTTTVGYYGYNAYWEYI